MYIVKCLPCTYSPYFYGWYYYYGLDDYNMVRGGYNYDFCEKYETYREALDKVKTLWYDYRYESKIVKV